MRVAVVLPVRSGGLLFDLALRSIAAQTHRDLDILVSVNAPTADGIIDQVAELADPRIRVLTTGRPLDIATSHDFAVRQTHADVVAVMGADDLAYPSRIARQLQAFEQSPGLVGLGTWCAMIDDAGSRVGALRYPAPPWDLRKRAIWANPIVLPTIMFRRSAYDAVGGFDGRYGVAFDFSFILRLLTVGECANVPEELLAYRYSRYGGSFRQIREFQRRGFQLRWDALRSGRHSAWDYLSLTTPLAALMLPAPVLRVVAIPYMRLRHGRTLRSRKRR